MDRSWGIARKTRKAGHAARAGFSDCLGDGVARAVDVKTGIRDGADIEIREGLAEGDEYVAMGQNKLTDGAAIERVAAAE